MTFPYSLASLALFTAMLLGSAAHAETCTIAPGGPETVIDAVVLQDVAHPAASRVVIGADGHIRCVGPQCKASLPHPRVIHCPSAVLSAGFINPHDHIDFTGIAPLPDSGERFIHRHEWRKGLDGHTKLENAVPTMDTEVIAWGELRQLISGTTAVVGERMAPGLLRNLDFSEGIGRDVSIAPVLYKIFPLDDAPGIMRLHDCDYGHHPTIRTTVTHSHAFLAHVAEGTGEAARNEFRCLNSTGYDTIPQKGGGGTSHDLLAPQMTVLHGVGLSHDDLKQLGQTGGTLVWSPRSNLSLYGRTLDVIEAMHLGIPIALGTDWLPSGSMNMSRELACAARYNRAILHGALTPRDLWRMATIDGAKATHDTAELGTIAPGKAADLVLMRPAGADPFAAASQSTPVTIELVMRGGKILYGDAGLITALNIPACEDVTIGGLPKKLCIRADQPYSFATLRDDMARQKIYPLYADGTPPNEPPCETLEETARR